MTRIRLLIIISFNPATTGASLTYLCIDMVRRLADLASTQFITTTFRQELVKVADKIYGVTHKHRVSRVNVVTKEEALNFIDHDQSHNEVSIFFMQ